MLRHESCYALCSLPCRSFVLLLVALYHILPWSLLRNCTIYSFGQRYQKAPDSSDVIVTHQRIPAEANTGEVECLVCTETKGANAFPRFSITSSCTHPPSTCLDCIQLSIESDLSSKLWTEIRCPECRELLEYADIQRYANNQTFTRYVNEHPYGAG